MKAHQARTNYCLKEKLYYTANIRYDYCNKDDERCHTSAYMYNTEQVFIDGTPNINNNAKLILPDNVVRYFSSHRLGDNEFKGKGSPQGCLYKMLINDVIPKYIKDNEFKTSLLRKKG